MARTKSRPVLEGKAKHQPYQKKPPKEQPFQLLVDIQGKMAEGKSVGYKKWATKFNLKEMSKTLLFLQDAASKAARMYRNVRFIIIFMVFIIDYSLWFLFRCPQYLPFSPRRSRKTLHTEAHSLQHTADDTFGAIRRQYSPCIHINVKRAK